MIDNQLIQNAHHRTPQLPILNKNNRNKKSIVTKTKTKKKSTSVTSKTPLLLKNSAKKF
jgi:hypothetical protein